MLIFNQKILVNQTVGQLVLLWYERQVITLTYPGFDYPNLYCALLRRLWDNRLPACIYWLITRPNCRFIWLSIFTYFYVLRVILRIVTEEYNTSIYCGCLLQEVPGWQSLRTNMEKCSCLTTQGNHFLSHKICENQISLAWIDRLTGD